MGPNLFVTFGEGVRIALELRTDSTPTVKMLVSKAPFESSAHRWGDEVYFDVPFHAEIEPDARQDMDVGEVAFWPDGDALAIFFGPTPVSKGSKPRAYSPCNIVGRVGGDPSSLSSVEEGTVARVIKE